MIILLGKAFLVIVGRRKLILKNSFCLACFSFQIKRFSEENPCAFLTYNYTCVLVAGF